MEIKINNLSYKYDQKEVLKDINLTFQQGKIYTILGPNGTGKSTLLKLLNRWLKLTKGCIFYDGQDITVMKNLDIARKVAIVPQENNWQYDFIGEEIVIMGRYPHLKRFEKEGIEDFKIAYQAMNKTNTEYLKNRNINKISGGEKQRLVVARALAQETDVILLDEPVSQLDLQHQLEIMRIIRKMANEENKLAICVLHDINLAISFSDELIFIKEGSIYAQGRPEMVVSKTLIKDVYGVDSEVIPNQLTGKPHIIYGE